MAKQRIDYLKVDRLDIQETLVAGGTNIDIATLGSGTDEKAKVSSNDTTPGFLNGKLVAGTNVTLTENNNGGNETLTISANFTDADDKSKVSANDTTAGFLNGKLVAGTNVTLTENNNGGNETLTISATVPVTSVNTLTGAVTLTAANVGAAPTSHTHAASDVTSGVFATARLASSGTASASTYLRGDQTWATVASGGGLTGTNYVYVAADGTDLQNGTALLNAYTSAVAKTPSASKRVTVIAAAGRYDFNGSTLTMNTAYVDLVSLDGNRSVILTNGSINVTANNVFVCGIDTSNQRFQIATNLTNLYVKNCIALGSNSFGGSGIVVSGKFEDCDAGSNGFGGECTASGTFVRCTGANNSFGGFGGTASGIFTDCIASDYGFAANGGAVSSGTFYRCRGGFLSFGGSSSISSGTYYNCIGGRYAFGGSAQVRGNYYNCIGDEGSWNPDTPSNFTGKLYYCRKLVGAFDTVAVGGRVYYSVDGNGNVNNQ